MKVLITADAVGGVWTYVMDLALTLPALGVEPVVAVLGPAPSTGARGDAAGLALIETGLALDWLAEDAATVHTAGRRLAELAGDTGCALLHLNSPALAADVAMPVPVVALSHSCLATWWAAVETGPVPEDFRWRSALHGKGLRAAAVAAAPSRSHADATAAAYGLPAVTTVWNGRSPLPSPAAGAADLAFTAGRLWDRGKDAATFDRAAALAVTPFAAAGPLTGPGGETQTLAAAEALGVLPAAGLAARLAARPVFVSTARYEPFGLAVLEAAKAGCALVLSDIPTFRELWSDAAMFVAPGDAPGFARAVDALVADPGARAAAGERARAAAARFTVAAMAEGTAALYTAAFSKGARAA